MMDTPPVLIREYRFSQVSVATRETYNRAQPIVCQVSISFAAAGHPENANAFKVDLDLAFDAEGLEEPLNLPYDTSVRVHGFFDTPIKIVPTAIPAPLVLNALMILYGVARGYIGVATASYPHGQFVIPSVVFDSVVERAIKNETSNVVAVTKEPKRTEEGVAELTRFLFAIDNLARYTLLIDDEQLRQDLKRQLSIVIDSVNAFSDTEFSTKAFENCQASIAALRESIERVSGALHEVLLVQLEYVETGVRQLGAGPQRAE